MAEVHRGRGDGATAALELDAAARAFERVGARGAAQRARRLLSAAAPDTRAHRAFMFTDIVDSTRLVEVLGDDAWQSLLAWHDRTLRTCFDEYGGAEVKHEGDGFFVAFDRPVDAVSCAVGIQRALAAHRQEHGFAPPVRIGVHTAEATVRAGDYVGRGVHEAARIAARASENEILASEATLAAAGDHFDVTDRRSVELKGLATPMAIATVAWR
jgi:class 3 adenylate cyclase